jgi:hypothetical protein
VRLHRSEAREDGPICHGQVGGTAVAGAATHRDWPEAVMPTAESRGMVGLSVSSDRLPAQPEKPVFRCFICRIGIRFVRELVFMPAGVMHLCCSGPPEPA